MNQISQAQVQITKHARNRMSERSIKKWQVEHVLNYGRICHNRKAVIYAVGRKEVRKNGRFLEPCEGVHVICSSKNEIVITVYKNHDLRGLRH